MADVNMNESTPTRRLSIQITEEETVGFENDAEWIIKQLISGTKKLDIISIFGMPGLGKTTLAKKIFKNSSIVSHFKVKLWCTVSQSRDIRKLLMDIYRQVMGDGCNVDENSDIADMLHRSLIGKKYLIVLDDIWEVRVWEKLRLSFPKEENESRIILTTRHKKVSENNNPYHLRFLTTEESWKLLRKKAFKKKGCPSKLQAVGRRVADYCKGLPLTIVLIGGILASKKKNVSEWCEIENKLKSHVGAVGTESNLAILLSYNYLPVHLRQCLLTMGMLREDEPVQALNLMLLWMAEGFIQCKDERRLTEEVAERYLRDLISSSLVMIAKTSSYNGDVKLLQLHDLVRDFCIIKAKEEKFMQVIGLHNEYEPSYDGEHRVCIHLNHDLLYDLLDKKDNFMGTSFGQNLSSLFVANEPRIFVTSNNPSGRLNFSSVGEFRLLRVLNFTNCTLRNYQNMLQSLLHLRYLAMGCLEFSFKWVSHLSDLETLLVDSERCVDGTPHIWNLTKLRHVQLLTLLPRDIAISEEGRPPSTLENLRTFHGMSLDLEDAEALIKRFPNLQTLFLLASNESGETDSFLRLQLLTELQLLTLYSPGLSITNCYFPSSLKKLVLIGTHISSCAASAITEVTFNLEILKFIKCEFEENKWDVTDVEFPALKILRFRDVALRQWDALDSSFPMLEILVIKGCRELEMIPDSFVNIETLKSIKLIDAQDSVNDSALDIKKYVKSITGCDALEVHISPPYSRKKDDEEEEEQEDEEYSGAIVEAKEKEDEEEEKEEEDEVDEEEEEEEAAEAKENEEEEKVEKGTEEKEDHISPPYSPFKPSPGQIKEDSCGGKTFNALRSFLLCDFPINPFDPKRRMADHLTEGQISGLKKVFSLFDKDGDGLLTAKDLETAIQPYEGIPVPEALIPHMINVLKADADADGDGAIDLPGFLYLMAHIMKDTD